MLRLIDTAVLVDHLRGDSRARDLLIGFARGGDELWSVVLVRTEILAGMRRGEERVTHRLLDGFRWQDVTIEIADRAGAFARQYTKSHTGVDTVDYILAATALLLGAELVTLNVKHFPMLRDLRAAYR
jgi:predicted nucleic acid-binding protein